MSNDERTDDGDETMAVQEQEQAEESAKEKEVGSGSEVIKEFTRYFAFEMTSEERSELGIEMAEIHAKGMRLSADLDQLKKRFKADKDNLEAEIDAISNEAQNIGMKIISGKVDRPVECIIKKDWDAEKFYTIRVDTGECIEEREFAEGDHQAELFTEANESTEDHGDDQSDVSTEASRHDDPTDPRYVDDLGRELFISDGGTGKKWSTYVKTDASKDIYDKDEMPPVDSREDAILNLIQFAKDNDMPSKKEWEAENAEEEAMAASEEGEADSSPEGDGEADKDEDQAEEDGSESF